MTWILWDVLAMGLIAAFVWWGAKRGFVRTMLSLLCYVFAGVGARMLAPMAAGWTYENVVAQRLTQSVAENLSQALSHGATSGADLLAYLPRWVSGLLVSIFPEMPAQSFEAVVGTMEADPTATASQLVDSLLAQPVTSLLEWVFFFVLFLLLAVVIAQLARLFTGVNKLPVIGTVNMALGGIAGVVQALVLLVVLSAVLRTVSVLSGGTSPLLNIEALDQSLIMGTLSRWIL